VIGTAKCPNSDNGSLFSEVGASLFALERTLISGAKELGI